jgi:hypothetical protein
MSEKALTKAVSPEAGRGLTDSSVGLAWLGQTQAWCIYLVWSLYSGSSFYYYLVVSSLYICCLLLLSFVPLFAVSSLVVVRSLFFVILRVQKSNCMLTMIVYKQLCIIQVLNFPLLFRFYTITIETKISHLSLHLLALIISTSSHFHRRQHQIAHVTSHFFYIIFHHSYIYI